MSDKPQKQDPKSVFMEALQPKAEAPELTEAFAHRLAKYILAHGAPGDREIRLHFNIPAATWKTWQKEVEGFQAALDCWRQRSLDQYSGAVTAAAVNGDVKAAMWAAEKLDPRFSSVDREDSDSEIDPPTTGARLI